MTTEDKTPGSEPKAREITAAPGALSEEGDKQDPGVEAGVEDEVKAGENAETGTEAETLTRRERILARMPGRRLGRVTQAVILTLLTLFLLCGGAFYYLWTWQNGPALGERLARNFNKNARGRMTIGSVRWTPRAAIDILTGRDHKVVIEDMRFYDTMGRVVMHFPRIEAWGPLWPLIRHGHIFVNRGEVDHATFRVDHYRRPDGPSRGSGSLFEVGMLSMFESREHRRDRKRKDKHYHLNNLHVRRASLTFHHKHFELYFHRVEVRGGLFVDTFADDSPVKVRFSARPQGGEGSLRVAGRTIKLRNIEAPYVRTDPENPMNLSMAVAGTLGRARVRTNAVIEDFHGVTEPRIRLDGLLTDFAGHISSLADVPDLPDVSWEGGGETLAFSLSGPLWDPLVEARLKGLSARTTLGERPLHLEDIQGRARLKGRQVTLENLAFQTLGGALALKGNLDLADQSFGGTLSLHHVHTSSLLSTEEHRELLGGHLEGSVMFRGGARPRHIDVSDADLTLARQGRDAALPLQLQLQAAGVLDPERVTVRRLEVKGLGLRLTGRGQVDIAERRLRLAVKAEVNRLRQVLFSAGLPNLARGLTLAGQLRGTLDKPQFQGQITLRGAGTAGLRSNRLRSEVSVQGGTVSFRQLKGDLAGGLLSGQGRMALFDRRWRPQRRPYIDGRFLLVSASLAKLLPGHHATGNITAHMSLRGQPGALRGRGGLVLRDAVVAGQAIERGSVDLRLDRHQVALQSLAVKWKHAGRLEAHGTLGLKDRRIDISGDLWDLPLGALLPSKALRAMADGTLSGRFHLQGTETRPLIEAMVSLAAVKLRGLALGEGTVAVTPQGESMQIRGSFFERFRVNGQLRLHPEPRLVLRIAFEDLAIGELIPELRKLPGKVEVIASGRVEVTLGARRGVERLEAVLTKVKAHLTQRDALPGETPGRVAFHNEGPIRLLYDGQRVQILQARLGGPSGSLSVTGLLTAKATRLRLRGRLQLETFGWLAAQWLDDLQGQVWLKGELSGPLDRLRWRGEARLAGLVFLPLERRVPVRIPTAIVHITHRELRLEKARVAVHTDEVALSGRVSLERFEPGDLDLTLQGKLSAHILHLLMPHTFNHVTGRARAHLRLRGYWDNPMVTGNVQLEPMGFTLRGSGREFALQSGRVEVRNRRITIREVRGSVDAGSYVVDGSLYMTQRWPWDMDITVRGQGIPVRKSRAYELELNAALHYRNSNGQTSLSGTVDVADGRYIEPFDVVSHAFLKRRSEDKETAFWETNPLLRDARLNVVVATQGPLIVKNNLADIRLEGNISLGGTPRNPIIGGRIAAESGTFRIPFLRGEYRVQSGEVDFDHPFGFGETFVRIIGETTYTDHSETEHDINLTLEGPVSRISIKLSSSTGLNQSQIVMLLASGRTVDDLRKQVRTTSGGPGQGGRSSNPLDAYDSSLKQVTGDFLSQLVAKPLQTFTKLDLVRVEMGTESFQVRVNKHLGRNVRLAGEAEFGLLGRQRQEGRVEVRLLDQLSLDARARRLIPGEDTVIDEDRYQGRLELRYQIRMRHSLRRALGF